MTMIIGVDPLFPHSHHFPLFSLESVIKAT
jgi:hypothetical protein